MHSELNSQLERLKETKKFLEKEINKYMNDFAGYSNIMEQYNHVCMCIEELEGYNLPPKTEEQLLKEELERKYECIINRIYTLQTLLFVPNYSYMNVYNCDPFGEINRLEKEAYEIYLKIENLKAKKKIK